ncbi:hypothetical protein CC86DRAFT_366473 [Ophiobolus disseminans]|uniref:Uncharacterized protein n=1 Tax=Ophiobolus disseminans TaxID=1469910 RepID=A0A6A7ACL6_9PLEO|nr:hypothetical protein CC86DRAFT_366473 [Ophiobolus disseminans]
MASRKPRLVWIDTKEISGERGYFNPELDELLHVPGNEGYIGRGLHCVQGNTLRGREQTLDTLNIWYIDNFAINNLQTNQSLHGTLPTLIGDAWGEMIWKGPMVAVLKVGNELDPRQFTDITLTAYRDAIDFLGYYRDGYGSMVHGIGAKDYFSQKLLGGRAGKVKGVRINCLGDQAGDPSRQLLQVDVPKAHPLFNLESDDPLDIVQYLDMQWVLKSYGGKHGSSIQDDGEQHLADNPLVRLLLLQVQEEDEEWGEVSQRRLAHARGSVLVVDRAKRDLEISMVHAMCRMIEEVVVPLIAANCNRGKRGRKAVLEAITLDKLREFIKD